MSFDKLFITVDNLVGDIATFKGLTFNFDNGVLVVDTFTTGHDEDFMYVCDFIPQDEYLEPVSFAAKGVEELKEQIEHYVLQ